MSETANLPTPPVDHKLINELFEMDPLKLSDQDLDVIIAQLRKDRLAFQEAPKAKKGSAAAKEAVVPLDDLGLLEQLGLDI